MMARICFRVAIGLLLVVVGVLAAVMGLGGGAFAALLVVWLFVSLNFAPGTSREFMLQTAQSMA